MARIADLKEIEIKYLMGHSLENDLLIHNDFLDFHTILSKLSTSYKSIVSFNTSAKNAQTLLEEVFIMKTIWHTLLTVITGGFWLVILCIKKLIK